MVLLKYLVVYWSGPVKQNKEHGVAWAMYIFEWKKKSDCGNLPKLVDNLSKLSYNLDSIQIIDGSKWTNSLGFGSFIQLWKIKFV